VSSAASTPAFHHSHSSVAELRVGQLERVAAPSFEEFERRYIRRLRPVILTGLTESWPPGDWSVARVGELYGSATVVAAELVGGTLRDDARGGAIFRRIPLGEFVASMGHGANASHYVMAPVGNLPPAFHQAYRVPRYCEGATHLRAKFWLGRAGTVTPPHWDVPHNLNVHLSGRKRWMLFAPGQRGMYPRGMFSGMPNFSAIDPERPDFERYPLLRGVTALGGIIEAGETLFIPRGWWHHTRTLEDAVAINFWWGGPAVQLASLASTLFKRVTGIRQDEWAC